MKLVYRYADKIKSEIEGAREYAEEYVIAKMTNQPIRAKVFCNMANEELVHASNLLSIYSDDMVKLDPHLSDKDKLLWDNIGREYVESIEATKNMLI